MKKRRGDDFIRPPRGMGCASASQTPMFGCGTAAGYRMGSIPCNLYQIQIKRPPKGSFSLEQMTGIEPAYSAWEADVLPLNYICVYLRYYYSTAVPSLSITQK